MGAARGQRNRDQDRYWQARRKWEQSGMVATALEADALCLKCGGLTIREQLHKGWCLSCVAEWVDSTDPWLIYQAQSQLPRQVVPATIMKQMETLQEHIAEPIKDEDFLPLTQFMGHKGVGSQRTMWNFLHALYTFELETTSEAHKLGVLYPNTVHLCGRHAPVQRMSIQGFLSRINSAGDDFKLFQQDTRFRDYVRGFAWDNRLTLFTYQRTAVDVFERAYQVKFVSKYGQSHFDKHSPVYWPFENEHDGKLRDAGKKEELPDFVMAIGQMIPATGMPASLREDLCQDLCVAVLTGEVALDELRIESRMRHYIRQAFQHHPLRYGRYSLDLISQATVFKSGKADDISKIESVTYEDISPERAEKSHLRALCVDPDATPHGWHEGRERPKGIATVAEVARQDRGYAIQGPHVIRTPEEIDEDIQEVFFAETHPGWRRKLSD